MLKKLSIPGGRKGKLPPVLYILNIFLLTCALVPAQKADPFYINLFRSGEKAFKEKDYVEAAKSFEIALFGLYQEKELMARGNVYSGLCHFYLDNKEKGKKYLTQAVSWLDESLFNRIRLDLIEKDRETLDKLWEGLGLKFKQESPEPARSPEEEASKKQEQAQAKGSRSETEKKEVEVIPTELPSRVSKGEQVKAPERKSREQPQAGYSRLLTDIVLNEKEDALEVEILCDPYTSHRTLEIRTPLPERIVIDLMSLVDVQASHRIEVNDFGIQAIRAGMFKPEVARVVLDASGRLPSYRIERSPQGLLVIIPRSR